MANENIKVGEIYSLDLGSLAPVEIKVLELKENKVLCQYLNSTPGRTEELDYFFFN